ncbi:MAG: metal-binding protein, partial [Rhodospirillaceae bacterium]|nr:metal-binding protein [Rhodospirillaceae bacterium]
MDYDDPGCAYCPDTVRACRVGETDERGPGFCPTKVMADELDAAVALYDDPEVLKVAQVSGR